MRCTSSTPHTGQFFHQGLIGAEIIALKQSLKSSQLFDRHLMRPSLIEYQDDVSVGPGKKPQISLSRLALDLRIEHPHRRLVDLQVIALLHSFPHPINDQAQEPGDVLYPLHHLLPGNDHSVPLPENPLQRVKGHMIVVFGEKDEHGQPQPQAAARDQGGRQQGDSHPATPTLTAPFDPHRPAHNQLGRDQIYLFADFLPDLIAQLAAMRARRVRRLEHRGDHFQLDGHWVPSPGLLVLLLLHLGFVGQNLLAVGPRTCDLLLQIPRHLGQLGFLLRSELLGLRPE